MREVFPTCGTTLTYGKDATDAPELEEVAQVIYIAVASLDDPDLYPPDEIVHVGEKIDRMQFTGDLPLREIISPEAGQLKSAVLSRTKRQG